MQTYAAVFRTQSTLDEGVKQMDDIAEQMKDIKVGESVFLQCLYGISQPDIFPWAV